MKYVDFRKILKVISEAGSRRETVKIYYPKTENAPAGWREVEPYSLTTDIGPGGEHLIYGQDRLSPGHIFNGYTAKSGDDHCDSFIVGKIKMAKLTGKKFASRKNWKVEF